MSIDNTRFDGSMAPPSWVRALFGIVLILGGMVVVGDAALASFVSADVIGVVTMIGGAFEVVHALWTKGWEDLVWQVLLGTLYIAFGLVLVVQPNMDDLLLTYVLGLLLVTSGVVRILLSFYHWREFGWMIFLSGAFGVLAGLVILTGFPKAGLWVLVLLLGIDLLCHGATWLSYAWFPFARPSSSR